MAQSSAGIKLYYGTGTISGSTRTPPTALSGWTEIPDITSIPSLQGDPNMLDTTDLAQTVQKTYIMGLADNGGTMQYGGWLTNELMTAAAAAATAVATTSTQFRCFMISFPAPLSKSWWYEGKAQNVLPGEVEVDGVLACNFNTSMETAPAQWVAAG